jgi:hypothetical protein
MKKIDHIINTVLQTITEQEAKSDARVTANAKSDADTSPFTPAEEKFLGKFDAYGTTHLGVIYSPTDIGIREFIARSGNDLNITPGILLNLIRNQVIKIVPYTGFGRNTDYTIELHLSLDDVKGLGKEDKEKIEAGGGDGSSAAASAAESPMPEMPSEPAPEVAGYIPSGKLIKEGVLDKKINIHLQSRLDEHINLLYEADTLKDSPEREYLKKQGIPAAYIISASKFWERMTAALSGTNWDEEEFYKIFDDIIFDKNNPRLQAIIIDTVQIVVQKASAVTSSDAVPAIKFLTDWYSKFWDSFFDISKQFNSIDKILKNSSIGKFIFNDDREEFIKFSNKLNTKGIGRLIMSSTTTDLVQNNNFFPMYSDSELNAMALKLVAPYRSGVVIKGGVVTKTKPVTFADTLSKEEKIKRGKAAKDQIKKNIDKFIVNMPDGKSKENVRKIVDLYNAWVDPKGYGYVYAATTQGNQITRLYPDSKWAVVDKKTGKVIKSGETWYWEWSSTDKKWNLVISSK